MDQWDGLGVLQKGTAFLLIFFILKPMFGSLIPVSKTFPPVLGRKGSQRKMAAKAGNMFLPIPRPLALCQAQASLPILPLTLW